MNGTSRDRFRGLGRSAGVYVAAMALAAFVLGPLAWMLLTALKPKDEIFTSPPTWWPSRLSLDNFATALTGDFALSFANSAVVCVAAMVACMVLALLACYPLSRPGFRGGPSVLGGVLVAQLLPYIVLLVPIYRMAREVGMLNTRWGLAVVLLAINLPVGIWLLRGFLAAVPMSLEEAARTDGMTQFRAYWQVTVPLAAPGVLAVAVWVFFTTWQEFIFALVFLTDPALSTAPLALLGFIGQHSVNWGVLMAASTIMMIPVLVLFYFVQRSFVGGLTNGAVKG